MASDVMPRAVVPLPTAIDEVLLAWAKDPIATEFTADARAPEPTAVLLPPSALEDEPKETALDPLENASKPTAVEYVFAAFELYPSADALSNKALLLAPNAAVFDAFARAP